MVASCEVVVLGVDREGKLRNGDVGATMVGVVVMLGIRTEQGMNG
jgi:hypothetical protein